MPNWCVNTEIIAGPKDEIKKLFDNLVKWSDTMNTKDELNDKYDIYRIAKRAGIDTHNLSCRGNILEPFDNDEEGVIRFITETAWAPIPETWETILKKHAPNCKYFYASEEPGCTIYCTNDRKGMFFDKKYVLDGHTTNVTPECLNYETLPEYFTPYGFKWFMIEVGDKFPELKTDCAEDFIKKFNKKFSRKNISESREWYLSIFEVEIV